MIQKYSEILKELNINPKTVLEVGSRDGNDANYFKEEFNLNNEDIYIVEPNPMMAENIKLKYPNYTLLQFAVSPNEGTAEFNQVVDERMDPVGVSSLLNRNDNFYERFKTNKITVNTTKGSTILNIIDKDIDICKIDVEGLTYEVLESFGDSISRIKSFHLETEHHSFWENQKLHDDVCDLMDKLGYFLLWKDGGTVQSDTVWIQKQLIMKDNFEGLEIHTLICKRDILLAINNFKSLQQFEEFESLPVYLHDDGSLTDSDIELLSEIKNTIVIKRADADKEIEQYIKDYPNCMSYRLGDNPINLWHKIKTFDYFFFSKSKKILGMDTDLLFIRKPNNVIDLINTNTPFYFPDCQSSYCFNEPKSEVPVPEKVNTGLIFIPSEDYYNIDSLEFALNNLVGKGVNYFPSWIEQSAYAHMFLKDGRYVSLNDTKHRIPYFQSVDISRIECLHFVSYPAVRETYKTYLDYIEMSQGELVFEKEYTVPFKEHNIPLHVKMFKFEKFVNVEFYWGLEKTTQQFLDHIFKINIGGEEFIHKFQSNKNSFFIINLKEPNFELHHTYEWYGDMEWDKLDDIYIK
jgi:FkbM family methyltransferase